MDRYPSAPDGLTPIQERVRRGFWKLVLDQKPCGRKSVTEYLDLPPSTADCALQRLRALRLIPPRIKSSSEVPTEWLDLIPVEFLSKTPATKPEPAPTQQRFFPPTILPSDVGHPSGDLELEIERLREEIAELRRMNTWLTHSDAVDYKGGVLTLAVSDHHYFDKAHMVSSLKSLESKTLTVLDRFEPAKLQIVLNGDIVPGRGIYRQQALEAVLPSAEQQVAAGAWRQHEFDAQIREHLPSGVVPKYLVIKGTHDSSEGEDTVLRFTLAVRALGLDACYCGTEFVVNMASQGNYLCLFEHGYGSSSFSPSSNKLVFESLVKVVSYQDRGYSGDRRIRRLVHGHCFDDQTEILTPDGWVTHDNLTESSVVLTLNRKTDLLEWNQVQKVFRYDNYKELIHVKGAYGVDLAVTDKHGLYLGSETTANHRSVTKWRDCTAEDALNSAASGTKFVFRLAGMHDETSIDLDDSKIRVLAWLMAEGCFERNNCRPGAVGAIRIAQSDGADGRLDILRRDLDGAGLKFTEKLRYRAGEVGHGVHHTMDAYRINILNPVKMWDAWIGRYLTTDKDPTPELNQMSARQASMFLETFIIGDGSKCSSGTCGYQICAVKKVHIDWLQQLALRCGYRTTVIYRSQGIWCLTLNTRQTLSVKPTAWSRQPYSGTVWCVSVPNGTLVVRRNGRPCITLNTHWLATNIERAEGLLFDCTGGLHRNDRANLGKNSRPVGWIAYVSPPTSQDILTPIEIKPDRASLREDLDAPSLVEVNRAEAARCLQAWAEWATEQGIISKIT